MKALKGMITTETLNKIVISVIISLAINALFPGFPFLVRFAMKQAIKALINK